MKIATTIITNTKSLICTCFETTNEQSRVVLLKTVYFFVVVVLFFYHNQISFICNKRRVSWDFNCGSCVIQSMHFKLCVALWMVVNNVVGDDMTKQKTYTHTHSHIAIWNLSNNFGRTKTMQFLNKHELVCNIKRRKNAIVVVIVIVILLIFIVCWFILFFF